MLAYVSDSHEQVDPHGRLDDRLDDYRLQYKPPRPRLEKPEKMSPRSRIRMEARARADAKRGIRTRPLKYKFHNKETSEEKTPEEETSEEETPEEKTPEEKTPKEEPYIPALQKARRGLKLKISANKERVLWMRLFGGSNEHINRKKIPRNTKNRSKSTRRSGSKRLQKSKVRSGSKRRPIRSKSKVRSGSKIRSVRSKSKVRSGSKMRLVRYHKRW